MKTTGAVYGKRFESLIAHCARLQDLLLISHGTKAVYMRGGQTKCVKSDVDFRLSDKDGRTVFFDAKSFQGAHATASQFTEHQLQRLVLYRGFNLRAGFLVELRQARCVVFYDALTIHNAAPRARFAPEDGLVIGKELMPSLWRLLS